MNNPLAVIDVGMATPIGLDDKRCCAGFRTGVRRFKASPLQDMYGEPFILSLIPDNSLPKVSFQLEKEKALSDREQRIVKIANLALKDLSISAAMNAPLIIGWPGSMEHETWNSDSIIKNLHYRARVPFTLENSRLLSTGRTAGMVALKKAGEILEAGGAKYVVAGGADSYFDHAQLKYLEKEGRVKSSSAPKGAIGGEGACFLLLCTLDTAERNGDSIMTIIEGIESLSHYPFSGEGLANCVKQLKQNTQLDTKIISLYTDANGEEQWADELSTLIIRNRSLFMEDFKTVPPATVLGDLGAATGPVMIALAASSANHSYQDWPFLITNVSDGGQYAAAYIKKGTIKPSALRIVGENRVNF